MGRWSTSIGKPRYRAGASALGKYVGRDRGADRVSRPCRERPVAGIAEVLLVAHTSALARPGTRCSCSSKAVAMVSVLAEEIAV
jgi:hypothetical protein